MTTEPKRSGTAALVVGVGNRFRSDDAAGLEAAELIREAAPGSVQVIELEAEPTSLIDAWGGASLVYVLDAVSSGGKPGTVYRFDAESEPVPAPFHGRGTHSFSVAEVIELARVLDRLPGKLVAYGIEGEAFESGVGLSRPVKRAVLIAAERVLAELNELAEGGDP